MKILPNIKFIEVSREVYGGGSHIRIDYKYRGYKHTACYDNSGKFSHWSFSNTLADPTELPPNQIKL